jgi:hypothetical protein
MLVPAVPTWGRLVGLSAASTERNELVDLPLATSASLSADGSQHRPAVLDTSQVFLSEHLRKLRWSSMVLVLTGG